MEKVRNALDKAIGPEKAERFFLTNKEAFAAGREQGREQGLEQGLEQGARRLLERQLRGRFGVLDPATSSRLAAASMAEIELWADRALEAKSLADVFVARS